MSPVNGDRSPKKMNSEKPIKCESSPPKTSSRNSNLSGGGATKREVGPFVFKWSFNYDE